MYVFDIKTAVNNLTATIYKNKSPNIRTNLTNLVTFCTMAKWLNSQTWECHTTAPPATAAPGILAQQFEGCMMNRGISWPKHFFHFSHPLVDNLTLICRRRDAVWPSWPIWYYFDLLVLMTVRCSTAYSLSLSPSLPVNLHEVYFPSGQLGIVQFGEENKNAAIDEPAWHL